MAKKKIGIVTVNARITIIALGDRDAAIIDEAKNRIADVLKTLPNVLVYVKNEPVALNSAQTQTTSNENPKKRKKKRPER